LNLGDGAKRANRRIVAGVQTAMNSLKESDTPWKKLKLFAWSSQENLKMR